MLSGRRLSFRYRGAAADVFSEFDIDVVPGEFVALSGPSGRGKTTLARILAGYEQPSAGTVMVDGKSIDCLTGFCPVQLVFQHPEKAVNPRWTMRRVLAESGLTPDEIVEALGIEREWMGRFPNEISGGELQRFCVARALTRLTRYLIADEMTTMLDALTQAHIWRIVTEWAAKQGTGVLVVSHDKALISRVCNRVIELPKPPERKTRLLGADVASSPEGQVPERRDAACVSAAPATWPARIRHVLLFASGFPHRVAERNRTSR